MIDGQDILKKLKDYEVEPPAALQTNIFAKLNSDFNSNAAFERPGIFSQLQEIEIKPPAFLYPAIDKKIVGDIHLSFLQHFEMPPPVNAYSAIIEKIAAPIRLQETAVVKNIQKIYRYRVAVAIIIIALISFFVYEMVQPSSKKAVDIAGKNVKPGIGTDKQDSTITKSTEGTVNNSAIAKLPIKKKKKKAIIQDDIPVEVTMSVDDYKFPVVDNDLLFTFASFTYTALPSFVTDEEKKEFSIRIDQYAAINVSENMTKMIRRMNLFRNNGKLTNKARRSRATQEKWKKADADHFDNSLIKNPLDVVDLAEFIFK